MIFRVAVLAAYLAPVMTQCPGMTGSLDGNPHGFPSHHAGCGSGTCIMDPGFEEAAKELDWEAVRKDIMDVVNSSDEYWPSDWGTYAGTFVRMAWHAAGTYRIYDGRGGADGGRQRFEPEQSWEDNANVIKYHKILLPIKQKYGRGLSWADLIALAGDVSIESVGGPLLGFCAGRVDEPNGYWSREIGPTVEQEVLNPCEVDGDCQPPLGQTQLELIYVNPAGPMEKPDPVKSAENIRDSFARMGMNDTETIALAGGGHAFGKTHGACPAGPGEPPKKNPADPWHGQCGTGKGDDAFTAGFEVIWTEKPTTFDNAYFQNLRDYDWEVFEGPGGRPQWRIKGESPKTPGPYGGERDLGMLTTDVALNFDPEGSYQKLVEKYAADEEALRHDFKHAWYKLMTRDMGPVERCIGPWVPEAQPFQLPLPPPPSPGADFSAVAADVNSVIYDGSEPTNAPELLRLAYQCAASFRITDYQGGCNGARIRFSPEKDWPSNAGLDQALKLLEPVKRKFGDSLPWADLIVMGGHMAVEATADVEVPFCGGRSDAPEYDGGSDNLQDKLTGATDEEVVNLHEATKLTGLTVREYVALSGRRSLGEMHAATGYKGAWTSAPLRLDNEYFVNLITETWEPFTPTRLFGKSLPQYKAKGKELYAMHSDLLLLHDAEYMAVVQEYAADNGVFMREFVHAFVKLMNIDRFDGPTGNLCHKSEGIMLRASLAQSI